MTIHETPDPLTLRLRLPAGRIEITTWDEPRTEVEIEPIDDDDASREAAAAVRQELRRSGGRTELLIESRRGRFGIRRDDPPLLFRISAPHGADVNASSAAADLTCRGSVGVVEVSTASGDVAIDEAAEATVKTVSGDVRIERVDGRVRCGTVSGTLDVGRAGGDASFSTVSGEIRLGSADASVAAKGVSGNLSVDRVAHGDAVFQSVSGDITVGVARGATVWMDVGTLSGDTHSDLDPVDGTNDNREVDLRLKASSTSGDIRLQRAVDRAPV
jgi:hypothetical protein